MMPIPPCDSLSTFLRCTYQFPHLHDSVVLVCWLLFLLSSLIGGQSAVHDIYLLCQTVNVSWMRRVDDLGGELTAHKGGST